MKNSEASNCAVDFLCYEIQDNIVNNPICSVKTEVDGVVMNDEYPACTSQHNCTLLCQSNQDIYS